MMDKEERIELAELASGITREQAFGVNPIMAELVFKVAPMTEAEFRRIYPG